MENNTSAAHVLHAAGFRATMSRVRLLCLLERAAAPMSVQKIRAAWIGKKPDVATLYRSLTDLTEAGVVQRVHLNTTTAHFEYAPSRPHHHHIVCNNCGKVEELTHCSIGPLEEKIAQRSRDFNDIYSHSLEFFGRCIACEAT